MQKRWKNRFQIMAKLFYTVYSRGEQGGVTSPFKL